MHRTLTCRNSRIGHIAPIPTNHESDLENLRESHRWVVNALRSFITRGWGSHLGGHSDNRDQRYRLCGACVDEEDLMSIRCAANREQINDHKQRNNILYIEARHTFPAENRDQLTPRLPVAGLRKKTSASCRSTDRSQNSYPLDELIRSNCVSVPVLMSTRSQALRNITGIAVGPSWMCKVSAAIMEISKLITAIFFNG